MNQTPLANQSRQFELPRGEDGRAHQPITRTPEEIEAHLAAQNAEILRYYMAIHRANW